MKYDVFISYRRTSYESANLIATRLKARGYRVFFDLESMRSGPFNKQLYSVIEQCKDFVLVLPPDALDRCNDEGDWLRKEIIHAMECKKNIIPVMLNGFAWPEKMPAGMEELSMYQALSASPIEYFDLSMKRLEKYLSSAKHTLGRKVAKWAVAAVVALSLVLVGVELYLRVASVPACSALVDYMTDQIAYVDMLMDSNDKIAKALDGYKDSDKSDLIALLDFHEKEIVALNRYFPDRGMLDDHFDNLLLFAVTANDIHETEQYALSISDDVIGSIKQIRAALAEEFLLPSDRQRILAGMRMNRHFANSMYYSYLEVLTRLPEKSLECYHNAAETFVYMPTTGLGLKQAEYKKLIDREYNEIERILAELKAAGVSVEDSLASAERRLDEMVASIRYQYAMDLEEYAVSESRDVDTNWGNILLMGNAYLNAAYMDATDPEAEEGDVVALTTEEVYGDLVCMLNDFTALYPQLSVLVQPVNAYYKEVAELKRPLAGILCDGYSPEATAYGPLQIGDIVIAIDGKPISDMDKAASFMQKSSKGVITYLRYHDGSLSEHTCEAFEGTRYLVWCSLGGMV